MGLFSDLSKFGLGKYENAKILEEDKKKTELSNKAVTEEVVKKEEDFLFDKHYECPVCNNTFVSKCMKVGRVKPVSKDTDLRPIYADGIDPIKYDAIACPKCGYAAITRYFGKITPKQTKAVMEGIGNSFKGINNHLEKYTYDDAIERYKLAMVNTIVKGAKSSERAYTCFKLSWVIRAKRENLLDFDPQKKGLYADELECLKNSYEGFVNAMQNEAFPIAGMDENTFKYILADMARKLKRYEESAKLISSVVTSRAASARLKDEALKLKELIKEDMKNDKEKATQDN